MLLVCIGLSIFVPESFCEKVEEVDGEVAILRIIDISTEFPVSRVAYSVKIFVGNHHIPKCHNIKLQLPSGQIGLFAFASKWAYVLTFHY